MKLFELPGAKRYFAEIEKRYPASMLLDLGKLRRDSEENGGDWSNVRRHCLVQAAGWEVLGILLGLEPETITKLANVAICHDWRKRIDKKSQANYFTENEKLNAEVYFRQLVCDETIDELLFKCLTPRFNLRALHGEATFLELLQWYMDDIARGDELVSFEERVAEVSARNPDPEPEMMPELAKLGFINYWDSERAIGWRIGDMIVAVMLSVKAVKLPGIIMPVHIPDIANGTLAKQISETAETKHV